MQLMARDYDPESGITEEFWYWTDDTGKGKITIRRYQDIDEVLTANREQFNSHADKAVFNDVKTGAFKAAEIPMILIEKWKSQGFDWFKAGNNERRKILNDPDYKKLRTRPGKL